MISDLSGNCGPKLIFYMSDKNRFKSILSMDFAYPTTMIRYSSGYFIAIERSIKIKQILKKLDEQNGS